MQRTGSRSGTGPGARAGALVLAALFALASLASVPAMLACSHHTPVPAAAASGEHHGHAAGHGADAAEEAGHGGPCTCLCACACNGSQYDGPVAATAQAAPETVRTADPRARWIEAAPRSRCAYLLPFSTAPPSSRA